MRDDRCDLLCLDLPLAEELRRARLDDRAVRRLAAPVRALADPTRLTVALALHEADELCVCDLAWILERAQNLVSHHLRALHRAGLVESRRDGKVVFYRLSETARAFLGLVVSEAEAVT